MHKIYADITAPTRHPYEGIIAATRSIIRDAGYTVDEVKLDETACFETGESGIATWPATIIVSDDLWWRLTRQSPDTLVFEHGPILVSLRKTRLYLGGYCDDRR